MRTSPPATGTPATNPLPGAWYALAARLGHAKAVAGCILAELPEGPDIPARHWAAINCVGGLGGAIEDILALCEMDLETLEAELTGAAAKLKGAELR